MPFNSIRFILFLAATAGLYRLVPLRARRLYLVAASYLFYFTWSVPYAALLMAATAIAYMAGLRIAAASENGQAVVLWITALALIGALAFFKCFNALSHALAGPRALELLAPLGVSYYTFKLMSYVIDVHWQKAPPERDLISLAAYAAFFPQIMSGPIQRASDFLTQLPGELSGENTVAGIRLIFFGLFQKMVVADRLALIVNQAYADPRVVPAGQLLAAIYAFSIQLYADFSGLTDIAIGASLFFGIRSPENFNDPFFSGSTTEFWRRWHMTLTSWLRDYAFTPLQLCWRGYGAAGTAGCLFLMMLAVGAWHGIQGHFLLFGVFNGVCLAASALSMGPRDRFFDKHRWLKPIRVGLAPALTFTLMSAAFVFFRAEDVPQAVAIFFGLSRKAGVLRDLPGLAPASLLVTLAAIATMELIRHRWRKSRLSWSARGLSGKLLTAAYYSLLFAFLFAGRPLTVSKFIYFQF
jgi:D-alanyl-lipoteichoic acid acyltransferase DltB (MBOAT superfamily)